MPKKKNNKKQGKIRINKRKFMILLCCLLAVFLVGYVAFSRYSHNQRVKREKVMFSNLENAVNDVAKQIEEELGTPTRGGVTPYCQMTGEKFSDGHLFCGISAGANFPVSSMDQAKEYGSRIVRVMDNSEGFGQSGNRYESALGDRWMLYLYYPFIQTNTEQVIPCTIIISYLAFDSVGVGDSYVGGHERGTVGYIIDCNVRTAERYFP